MNIDLDRFIDRAEGQSNMAKRETAEQVREVADRLNDGESLNVDHDHCPAGYDGKRRLWVKRDDSGHSAGYHCKHCGMRGQVKLQSRVTGNRPRHRPKPASQNHKARHYEPHYKTGCSVEDAPMKLRNWIYSALPPEYVKALGVYFSKEKDRLVLPVFRGGKVVRYDARRNGAYGAKYLSAHDPAELNTRYLPISRSFSPEYGSTVVICEDWTSAAKVSLAGERDKLPLVGVALWGTSFDLEEFVRTWENKANRVVVWLDNDNRVVRKRAKDIAMELETCYGRVRRVTKQVDPKQKTTAEIIREVGL